MAERIQMDKGGLVIFSYVDDEARVRFGYRIYEDETKKVLKVQGKKYPSKGAVFLAMQRAIIEIQEKE